MSAVAIPRPLVGSGVDLFSSTLTAAYAAGMRTDRVPLVDGRFVIAGPCREPVVLARLRRPLADEAVVVQYTVGAEMQPPVLFAPLSAEGTLLPLYRPTLPPGTDGAGAFTITPTVHRVTAPDPECYSVRPAPGPALSEPEAARLIEAVVLEGHFARWLYLGTLGSQRAIRMTREIAAARHLSLAHSRILDDIGRGLGVPRSRGLHSEQDERYRSRLAIYGAWALPTSAGLADALNGPGRDDEPNAGLAATFGITHRFRLVEKTNDLAIATKLVAVGGPPGARQRERFHETLRKRVLVDLERASSPLLPTARRNRMEAARNLIRTETTRPPGAHRPTLLTPLVATSLYRAVRLIRALGMRDTIFLNRAYDPDGGSRYELGLGVDLGTLGEDQLNAMGEHVDDLVINSESPEIGALAQSLVPRSFDDDPLGRWLYEPCGFRTVQELQNGDVYLSPLPTYGLVVAGPDELARAEMGTYRARHLGVSGHNPGLHILAQAAANRCDEVFGAHSLGAVPSVLSPTGLANLLQALAQAAEPSDAPDHLDAALAAGIVTADSKGLATRLQADINLDQVVAFAFAPAELAALGTGTALRDALVRRADAMAEAGFYSTRGVWDGARLVVLAAISQLPGAGGKAGEPPPASFRWYTTTVPSPAPGSAGAAKVVQPRGGRARVRGELPGLALVVCVSYVRRGLADPFEVRVELADPQAVLDAEQYGYVMNLLDQLHPLGVEINTFDIRRRHVDIDGDGKPEFPTGPVSRSYQQYRRRRSFGAGRGRQEKGI